MCESVNNYLILFEKFVQSFTDLTIIKLSIKLTPMMNQIKILSNILGISTNGN